MRFHEVDLPKVTQPESEGVGMWPCSEGFTAGSAALRGWGSQGGGETLPWLGMALALGSPASELYPAWPWWQWLRCVHGDDGVHVPFWKVNPEPASTLEFGPHGRPARSAG